MSFKAVITNFFTVVGLLVEPTTDAVKLKGYLEAYLSIRQPSVKVTYNIDVIYCSLLSPSFSEVC